MRLIELSCKKALTKIGHSDLEGLRQLELNHCCRQRPSRPSYLCSCFLHDRSITPPLSQVCDAPLSLYSIES